MTIVSNPQTIDLADIQGMVLRGYGSLMQTAYFLLKVNNKNKAQDWIKTVLPLIDSAEATDTPVEETLHLAFTSGGLAALGLAKDNVAAFPIPFREGMDTPHRRRQLGDYGPNAPENWAWGGPTDSGPGEFHILLIFHAATHEKLDQYLEEEKARLAENGGLVIVWESEGYLREDNKEPFGFHDGISQPTVQGSGRSGPKDNIVPAGEFLMGYENAYGQYPFSPLITDDQGQSDLLPLDRAGSGKRDLGCNGSFLVYRYIQQHTDNFWSYMEAQTRNADGSVDEEAKIRLAAKCVGRWPSGASLVEFPDSDPGGSPTNDDFGYAEKDPLGHRCPFGSHLRRNNPRDAFRSYGRKQSLKISNRHRIIRRGRTYTVPPRATEEAASEIGLHFMCFNSNIELQFEFIQSAWANNNQLLRLTNDVDVIIGVPAEDDPDQSRGQFTVQAEPVNEYVAELQRFVTIRGGEYFFFPGLNALKYLTTL